MKNLIAGFLLTIVCAFAGAFLAMIGAGVTGLSASQWSLEPLAYLALGIGVGAIGFLGLVGVLSNRSGMSSIKRMTLAASGGMFLAFLSGLIAYPLSKYDAEKNMKMSTARSAASEQRYKEFYSMLRADPEVSLRERWYHATDERRLTYRVSIQNQDVEYSASMLGRLFVLDDQMTVQLLKHPSFPPSLLESEFHNALKRALRGGSDCAKVQAILRNPNARDEWFSEVVSSGILEKDIFLCSESLSSLIVNHQNANGK